MLRLREFQHEQAAAGPQHAAHRGERRRLVGDVSQPEPDRHAIEAAIGEGQGLGIRDREGDLRAESAIDQPVAAAREHFAVDVGEHGESGGADLAREAGAEIAGAGGDVERALPGPEAGLRQCETLPQAMHAGGHQVVHQVVVAGDRIENAAHARGFLRGRDALVAEIDGFQGTPILRVRRRASARRQRAERASSPARRDRRRRCRRRRWPASASMRRAPCRRRGCCAASTAASLIHSPTAWTP